MPIDLAFMYIYIKMFFLFVLFLTVFVTETCMYQRPVDDSTRNEWKKAGIPDSIFCSFSFLWR